MRLLCRRSNWRLVHLNKIEKQVFEVRISAEQFESLRTDFRFQHILRFARFVNQLSFCFGVSRSLPPNFEDFRIIRQVWNSYAFTAAILFEALTVFDEMSGSFGNLNSYKIGKSKLEAHPKYLSLKELLKHGRDRVTFHVDKSIYKHELSVTEVDPYEVFVKGCEDGQISHMYFPLADELAFDYLFGYQNNQSQVNLDEKHRQIQETIHELNEIVILFLTSANDLIHEYTLDKGWSVEKAGSILVNEGGDLL